MAAENPDYDVIVVGGGGAGLIAAIYACDAGARVALLEADDRLGGSTALSGGLFYATETKQQQELKVIDDQQSVCADIAKISSGEIPDSLSRRFASEAKLTLDWLVSIGVEFPSDRLVSADRIMPARSHEPVGFGASIIRSLDYEVSKRDIDIAYRSRVQELIVDDTGAVCGVRLEGSDIHSAAVVLACGGIGGSPELLDRMTPKSRRVADWRWYVGPKQNQGDGLLMAESVGARICGKDSGLFLLSPNFYRDLEVIGPAWAMLVNRQGQRIVREDGGYWELSEAVERQEEGSAYYIFNEELLLASEPDERVLEALADGTITLNWIPSVIHEQAEKGKVEVADTLEDLARAINVDAAALAATVNSYNSAAESEDNDAFFKAKEYCLAMRGGPYYAVEVRPSIAIVTGAGAAIDDRGNVLAKDGRPIPGLYAAGEVTGNVYGPYYIGSGYAIGTTLTFGRRAGIEAASFATAPAGPVENHLPTTPDHHETGQA
tara:strand:- start:9 stop:1484 length:1476 start_codon:yes stop_codon:yes gene_type:complete